MSIQALEKLGYSVGVAHSEDSDAPTVYSVCHDDIGIAQMVAADDNDAIANLADPQLHAARVEVAQRSADGENVAIDEGQVVEVLPPEGDANA